MQRQKAVLAVVLGLALGGTALAQEQHQDRDRDWDRTRTVQQDGRYQGRRAEQQRNRDRNAATW